MSRTIFFFVSVTVSFGSIWSVQVAPVDADADAVHVSAITSEEIISPDSVSPWSHEVVDIESKLPVVDQPVVYMIPNEIGTPTPHENHELDREQIFASERRFYSIGMISMLCVVGLVCMIVKFSM